jgi:hypothetical protein
MRAPTVESFVRRGILPDDIPPIFTTNGLLDPSKPNDPNYQVTQETLGRPSEYNGSKRGFQRRSFGIPHPVFVRDCALFFRKHWTEIDVHINHPDRSASVPVFEETRHRALRITSHARLPALRLKSLAQFRFCLVTDISRCFPSIYTHSIPWALNGKAAAKRDRKVNSAVVSGNRLDYIIRQSQDGQTMGIPVGPDHSRVISEIVLASVDAAFVALGKHGSYLRHVDDIWVGGDSVAECEQSLHNLRQCLNKYALDINELKTRIIRTSQVISENWPYDIEAQLETALNLEGSSYEGRIVSLLGSVIEHANNDHDDGVIKFFLRKLDTWRKWDSYWSILEPFLAHCAIQFPHALDYVSQIISWRIRTMGDYNENLWGDVARKVVRAAAVAGRDSEAVWGLWLAKELRIRISGPLFKQLAENTNPLVSALLVNFHANGQLAGRPSVKGLWDHVEGNPLSGPSWPLALELHHAGFRPPASIDLDGPDQLKAIFDARCSIIDWNARPAAFVGGDGIPDDGPTSALRFSGSGYDNDDDDNDDDEINEDTPF